MSRLLFVMGTTVSVEARAVLTIMTLANKHDVAVKEQDVADLLLWGLRRAIFPSLEGVFDEQRWKDLENDLWQSVQVGNKEAIHLSQVWQRVSRLLDDTKSESRIMQAAEKALGGERGDTLEPPAVLPADALPVTLPVDAKDFFGATPSAPLLDDDDFMEVLPPPDNPLLDASMLSAEGREGTSKKGAQGNAPDALRDLQSQNEEQKRQLTRLAQQVKTTINSQRNVLKDLYQKYKTQFASKEAGVADTATQTVGPEQKWQGIIRDALVEGEFTGPLPACLLNVYPVQSSHTPQGQSVREWRSLDWKLLRELQKAVMEYGLNNPCVQNLIDVIFSQNVLTPFDVESLVSFILTPTQKLVFKDDWRKRVDLALIHNIDLRDDDPLRTATANMMLGQGEFANPNVQARLPARVLQQSQSLAAAALKTLPQLGNPVPPYAKIVQGPNEPFATYLDRLRAAIEKSPNLTPDARAAVGMDLAVQNANPVCRRILATLPRTAGLTEMIEACNRADLLMEQDKAYIYAKAYADALAVALKPLMAQPRQSARQRLGVCFLCGMKGHFRNTCPNNNAKKNVQPNRLSVMCNRCQKNGHLAKDCRSKYHKNGHLLTGQGDRKASALLEGAMTTNRSNLPWTPNNLGAWTGLLEPREGVLE